MLSQGVCVGDVMSSPLPLRQTGTTKKGMPFLFSRMAAVFSAVGKEGRVFFRLQFFFLFFVPDADSSPPLINSECTVSFP